MSFKQFRILIRHAVFAVSRGAIDSSGEFRWDLCRSTLRPELGWFTSVNLYRSPPRNPNKDQDYGCQEEEEGCEEEDC